MIPLAPRRALLVAALLALTACSPGSSAAEPDDDGTAFARTLARVDGPFDGYLEFVDRAALDGAPQNWSSLATGPLPGSRLDEIGIAPEAAASLLVVGQPPEQFTLVVGGQDDGQIRSRAAAAGWVEDGGDGGELRIDLTPAQPLSIHAATVRPLGDDVVFGGPAAPVSRIDGPGPALVDDPAVRQVVDCLGDVAVAAVVGGELGPLHAVGLRRVPGDEAAATSVVCTTGTSAEQVRAAVASTSPRGADRPWADHLQDPQVEQLPGGLVRLAGRNAPDVPITLVLNALQARDLPGVPA